MLPGIGRKSAVRMVLHLLRVPKDEAVKLGELIVRLRDEIRFCNVCHNIAEAEICHICSDHKRDKSVICVVEDMRDIIAIENTSQYHGLYHVLGGCISPMDGIGPSELNVQSLVERASGSECREVILALPATIEGDTTNFFLFRKLNPCEVDISMIARGISFGGELEYTDEVTLGRSILNRMPYHARQ
jgi:recombination protein RecR